MRLGQAGVAAPPRDRRAPAPARWRRTDPPHPGSRTPRAARRPTRGRRIPGRIPNPREWRPGRRASRPPPPPATGAPACGGPAAGVERRALGRHGARRHRADSADVRQQLTAHLARDLLLHPEAVGEIALEAAGPQVGVARGLDQLGRDPHPRALAAHRALDDVPHAQRLGDLRQGERASLEREDRGREITFRLSTWASWLMISSLMPSLKYSSLGAGRPGR